MSVFLDHTVMTDFIKSCQILSNSELCLCDSTLHSALRHLFSQCVKKCL